MAESHERIREAVLDLVFEHGCDGTSAEMVIERAEVEPGDFERDCGDIEGCFLKIYLETNDQFQTSVEAGWGTGDVWRDSLRGAAYAAARFLRDRPREVRFNAIQVFRAGDVALAERDRYHQLLVGYVDAGRQELDDPDSISRSVAEGVVGSIVATIVREVLARGDASHAEEFVPELMYIAVRPYLGEAAAHEELSLRPRAPAKSVDGG
jgi:AcrR family transcriptional regulator